MRIKEKIMMDRDGLQEHGPINIVIFGDSVSHGALDAGMDYETVYWNRLKQKLNQFRDYVPVNMICASIGGGTAMDSLPRLEKQVLVHEPDAIIISFGLNDVNLQLHDFLNPLREIFKNCVESGSEVIFMTPNMLNDRVAEDTHPMLVEYATVTAQMQTNGKMDRYMEEAKALANELGVTVCDCYAKWKELSKTQDITLLLCNRINHPNREMHALFADSLYDVLMGSGECSKPSDSTMYRGAEK